MSSTKKTGILFLSLAVLVAMAGSVACQKKAETTTAEAEDGIHEYEGTVRAALGRYMYLSTAQGFDIVLPGFDTGSLVGQTLKVKGKLLSDHPSIFLADSVEKGPGQVIYTRSQEFQTEDFMEMKVREAVPAVNISGVNKPEEWENKGRVKVYGKLQKGDVNYIVIADSKDREVAKIIVDSFTTFADYYIQKLKLFVDRRVRTRSKEIFHADVVDVGLY
jgi:hypothetical protein